MKNKTALTLYKFLFICFISILSVEKISAQEKGIYEISNSVSNNERSHFYNLVFKLHPTIYLKNNKVRKVYGEGVIKRITVENVNSFKMLNHLDSKYNNVELIAIKLSSKSDLNNHINLSKNSVLVNLKYIYIKSYFNLVPEDIINFIKVNPNVRVLYKSENPSE